MFRQIVINPTEIKQKAQRKYPTFLASTITGEPFFPLALPVGKLPKDFASLNQSVPELMAQSKDTLGYGYVLELRTRNHREHGPQSLPERIYIEDRDDYLKLLRTDPSITVIFI
ncbi:MAG: hypothetical protein DCF25_12225 [Leptolyngbya foveolarum]|uniref:DUF3322 domain-containing protein n=1 Tax=Leptolyngbya foveolarum TaxID=47253 RepID=A0A2W4WBN8_9CYAN|nr:MAG: hypothetical protein DCF25_12225 [Leptolyngbya foveolarum]